VKRRFLPGLKAGVSTPRFLMSLEQPAGPDAWTVERHLQDRPGQVVDMYRRFIALVEECGPFSYRVNKSAVNLKGSRVFAGAVPKHRWLGGYLDLQREVLDTRIQRVDPYTSRLFVNFFKVAELAELDDVFRLGMRGLPGGFGRAHEGVTTPSVD
jgi:hypothetical protein